MSDPDHVPDWYANIHRVTWETEKPLSIGTRLAFVARFLGRTLTYTYEVTDFVPGERLVMATAEGSLPDKDDVYLDRPSWSAHAHDPP